MCSKLANNGYLGTWCGGITSASHAGLGVRVACVLAEWVSMGSLDGGLLQAALGAYP